jgi:hypothetical protein
MSGWWYVLAIVVLAAAGLLYLRGRRGGTGGSGEVGGEVRKDAASPSAGYGQDREDARVAHMSEEDRAWEAASLQTERETRERDAAPGEHPPAPG